MEPTASEILEQLITSARLMSEAFRDADRHDEAVERETSLEALMMLRQAIAREKAPPWTKGDTVWHHEYGLVELGDRTVHDTWLVGDDGAEVSDHELRWPDDQAQRADEHRALSGVLDDLGVPVGPLVDRVQLLRERDVGGHSLLHRAQEERNKAASAPSRAAVIMTIAPALDFSARQ